MKRVDSYAGDFDPERVGPNYTNYTKHILNKEVHQVALTGNYREADLVVMALKLLSLEAHKAALLGQRPPVSVREVDALLATIAEPQFEVAEDIPVEVPEAVHSPAS